MRNWTFALACLAVLAFCGLAQAQSTVFEKVQVRFNKGNNILDIPHTREMVMYELAGAYYSDWQRK